MNPDSRNRVPGTSTKKRRFGRKKKRPRVFNRSVQNESTAMTSNLNDVLPSTAKVSHKKKPRLIVEDSSESRDINEDSNQLRTIEEDLAATSISQDAVSRSRLKLQCTYVNAGPVKNRIFDISLLFPGLEDFLACKKCGGDVKFSETDARGLGSKVVIDCTNPNCKESTFINSSRKVGNQNNAYEVNRRVVLAMRGLGQGHAGLKTLCGLMDFLPAMAHNTYDVINDLLVNASESVAKDSMRAAMEENSECDNEENSESDNQENRLETVSGDGSWRKRGFSSLQGVATLIKNSNGKVIDVAPKHSQCNECDKHPEEDTENYREWFEKHQDKCSANHQGSSGKMEVDGMIDMFKRSEETYGVKYKYYIGDGDSKVYKAVCNAKPYGENFKIEKKECIGHVQKRMGTRLRNLKKSLSGQELADRGKIGGKGRLTSHRIDELTHYYGNAIRLHSKTSVAEMKNGIMAAYHHKISTDENPDHHLCPTGTDSWCKWQVAKATNKLNKFHHTDSIPVAIMEKIKPIYDDLTELNLLQRCMGGFTQNSNESFNQSIWKLVPKHSFSGLKVLQIGVYIAVSCFNDGKTGILQVMKKLNVNPGSSAVNWAMTEDEDRIFWSDRRAESSTLEARRKLRKRKNQDDGSYSAGAY